MLSFFPSHVKHITNRTASKTLASIKLDKTFVFDETLC